MHCIKCLTHKWLLKLFHRSGHCCCLSCLLTLQTTVTSGCWPSVITVYTTCLNTSQCKTFKIFSSSLHISISCPSILFGIRARIIILNLYGIQSYYEWFRLPSILLYFIDIGRTLESVTTLGSWIKTSYTSTFDP